MSSRNYAEVATAMPWFDDRFENLKVTFNGSPTPSTWMLKEKLADRDRDVYPKKHFLAHDNHNPEARAVYICSKVDGLGPEEAVMKIKMQVPYRDTEHDSMAHRKKQAIPLIGRHTIREVQALKKLKIGGCQYMPDLIDWTHKLQEDQFWVPGGYIDFILMKKVTGIVPENPFDDFDREERDELRESFKAAWKQVRACGVNNCSTKTSNLIWDRETKKCYIIDFERWNPPHAFDTWVDWNFVYWGLAQFGPSVDLTEDMSKYNL